jgi:VanZ family protein
VTSGDFARRERNEAEVADLRRARLYAAAWGLFLLALTSWPSPPEVPVVSSIPDFDKVVHAFLYGVEGFLLYFAIRWPAPARFSWMRALVVGGALAVWGTLDELHQAWIPGRSMEAADALTDAIAGLAGGLAASVWSVRRKAGEATSLRS